MKLHQHNSITSISFKEKPSHDTLAHSKIRTTREKKNKNEPKKKKHV